MITISILKAIVKDLKRRGILTEVLQSAGVNPIEWKVFSDTHNPFEGEEK